MKLHANIYCEEFKNVYIKIRSDNSMHYVYDDIF